VAVRHAETVVWRAEKVTACLRRRLPCARPATLATGHLQQRRARRLPPPAHV